MSTTANIKIKKPDYLLIKAAARKERRTLQAVISMAVRQYVESQKQPEVTQP